MNSSILEEISRKISKLLAETPAADWDNNVRAMLSATFARLDLVTREEFDVQREVLMRSREKITQLEARLGELERSSKAQ